MLLKVNKEVAIRINTNENIWLSLETMSALYNVSILTINKHIKKIFADNELEANSVIRNFRITAVGSLTYEEFKNFVLNTNLTHPPKATPPDKNHYNAYA